MEDQFLQALAEPTQVGALALVNTESQSYSANDIGDGLTYTVTPGALSESDWLTFDFIVDSDDILVFELRITEASSDRRFSLLYTGLNHCEARLRIPVAAVLQQRWRYEREGAWLKPICFGDRVDVTLINAISIFVLRKASGPVFWTQGNLIVSHKEPAKLANPRLPSGLLADQFGQSLTRLWPSKTQNEQELRDRLIEQTNAFEGREFSLGLGRYGGTKTRRMNGTGYFRTLHDGQRWWLVDPDGLLFWSAGLDCVSPVVSSVVSGIEQGVAWIPDKDSEFGAAIELRTDEHHQFKTVNYLATNFIRAFGQNDWYAYWIKSTIGLMKSWGFNTVGNWSDTKAASGAQFPYVTPLEFSPKNTKFIFRDFPDVFSEEFEEDVQIYAQALAPLKDDPAMIGYFLMNEPTWGFASECPASGMLFAGDSSHTRSAFNSFLRVKYSSDSDLSAAWEMECTFDKVSSGRWVTPFSTAALVDLEVFSGLMVDRYFGALSAACRKVDPNHLNLGARYYTLPPQWAMTGMRHFDVFSVNCYQETVNKDLEAASHQLKMPVLIGEWHFGALDVGLPATGIGHVKNQKDRGRAFRKYTEDAAAQTWCVGVHYFTLYDQSCLGRFDGENYNIGLLDVCNRPYDDMISSVTTANSRIYQVASGESEAFDEPIVYLPKLFV